MPDLNGKIALVAGATRGAGRAIAVELGKAGATVYATGRTTRQYTSEMGRTETIEDTAEIIKQHGGNAFAVQVDHTIPEQVKALLERIGQESGKLDILINDVWGGDHLAQWVPFWEHDLQNGLKLLDNTIKSHIITSHHAVPLMIQQQSGLIIEITDGITEMYRGSLFYDLAKVSVNRLAFAQSQELAKHGITALALSPGFLRSEAMLDHFGVTEENWRDGAKTEPHFIASETPYYLARAVVALAADPHIQQKNGGCYATWNLYQEYGFQDLDGTQPDWGRYARDNLGIDAG
ncbi:SDR family oxidoreductase [Deinococcus roseus]|uniref:Short-chain dehydrogenase n=1 Tax=Deinococcus roseus TaxID=392414 RepID=A0ABQ2CUL1_9DEIO|nr:SDR family oxidoreductase [Deinococcus roseus]GGJ21846.1 short-chain dehydrogenase [Deinococcus roseus]